MIEHSSPIWLLKFPFSPGWKIGRKMCFYRLVPACYIWGSSVEFSCWLVFEFKVCCGSSFSGIHWGFMWISCNCQGKHFFCYFREHKFPNREVVENQSRHVLIVHFYHLVIFFFFFKEKEMMFSSSVHDANDTYKHSYIGIGQKCKTFLDKRHKSGQCAINKS